MKSVQTIKNPTLTFEVREGQTSNSKRFDDNNLENIIRENSFIPSSPFPTAVISAVE